MVGEAYRRGVVVGRRGNDGGMALRLGGRNSQRMRDKDRRRQEGD